MSEDNKALVRLVFRAMERGDLDAADELIHPDFVNHEAAEDRPDGPEGMKQTAAWLRETFGSPAFEEQGIVAEGDRVVIRILCKQIHEYRIQYGKIAEHWACRDDIGMMRQLGVIPDRQLAG